MSSTNFTFCFSVLTTILLYHTKYLTLYFFQSLPDLLIIFTHLESLIITVSPSFCLQCLNKICLLICQIIVDSMIIESSDKAFLVEYEPFLQRQTTRRVDHFPSFQTYKTNQTHTMVIQNTQKSAISVGVKVSDLNFLSSRVPHGHLKPRIRPLQDTPNSCRNGLTMPCFCASSRHSQFLRSIR